MVGLNGNKLMIGAIVAVAALSIDVPRAEAFWRWGGSSGGSWGGWASSGGSGGSWGGGRRWHRHRWHHSGGGWASNGSWGGSSGGGWGSSGGSSGGWGSSGGSSGGWGSSGGSHGSWGSNGGAVMYSPAMPDTPPPPPEGATPTGDPMTRLDSSSMMLTVEVPADARVYVNGRPTSSTGTLRRFVSRGLHPEASYTYEVRVEVERDGELQSDVKLVQVGAGESTALAFAFDGDMGRVAAQPEPMRTSLILHVPAEAKVYLAGRETTSTGEVREFATTRLTAGDEWADYPVRVEWERDGEVLAREATISLAAGESREVTIDFDTPQVARVER